MPRPPLLLLGTYTDDATDGVEGIGEGVLGYAFDPATGTLERRFAVYTEQPTYLVVDRERQLVYVNQEIDRADRQPGIQCFRVRHDARASRLELVNEQPLRGCVPCHLYLVPGRALYISGYASSNLSRMKLAADGSLEPQSLHLKFSGSGPRPEQDAAHIHCCAYDARRDRLYVADLGADRVRVLVRDGAGWTEAEALTLPVAAGSGPRHLLLHPTDPDRLVLLHELWPEISLLHLPDDAGPQEVFRFLPFAPPGTDSQGGAAVRTCGDGQYIYASERTTNTVAVLRYLPDAPALELVQRVSTRGDLPRDINLSPDGRWLIAANLNSHTLALFRRDAATGRLTFERLEEGVRSVSCVDWLV